MRLQKLITLLLSGSAALALTSCDMFRNDQTQANPNDPYAQPYGTGGAYGAPNAAGGGYGAPNPYGAANTNPYAQPQTGGYAPAPYTQPADPYAGSGGYASGGGNYGGGGAATTGGRAHTVVRGDTLSGIGRRYNVGVSELMRANNLNSDLIREGQKLTIP
jgi:nucleoid-associated protein YgaU